MKWILAFLVLAGVLFAGQVVNVGETTDGTGSGSTGPEDSECYTEYFQCLRDGCAAAGGNFNELTQGCYGGSDAKFSEAVGKCADAQGNCIMGTTPSGTGGTSGTSTSGGSTSSEEQGLCGTGFVLLGLGAFLFSRRNE
ncbi:MAG: hypothetical protein GY852_08765 [bacterium]|nr:hypothetical protein [bacterium]